MPRLSPVVSVGHPFVHVRLLSARLLYHQTGPIVGAHERLQLLLLEYGRGLFEPGLEGAAHVSGGNALVEKRVLLSS